jgi:hypothetical protein
LATGLATGFAAGLATGFATDLAADFATDLAAGLAAGVACCDVAAGGVEVVTPALWAASLSVPQAAMAMTAAVATMAGRRRIWVTPCRVGQVASQDAALAESVYRARFAGRSTPLFSRLSRRGNAADTRGSDAGSTTRSQEAGMSITSVAARSMSFGQDMALALAPHGGQLRARRNALRAVTALQLTSVGRTELARATAVMVADRERRDGFC